MQNHLGQVKQIAANYNNALELLLESSCRDVHGTHVHVYACVCNVHVCQSVIQPKLQPSLNKSGRNRHAICTKISNTLYCDLFK